MVREAAPARSSRTTRACEIHGVVGDFERHLDRVPPSGAGEPRLVALLGGTIGNFPPGTRRRLLRDVGALLGPDDRLLLGTDLVKDPAMLEAAYDDAQGVTAEFNRNVLHVINRELGADFDPDAFEHVAFFDRRREWIEMRLRARRAVHACAWPTLDLQVEFARRRGAAHRDQREVHARAAGGATSPPPGCALRGWYTDPEELFAVSLAGRRAIGSRAAMQMEGCERARRRRSVGARRGHAHAACTSTARASTIADLNEEKGDALADELGDDASFVKTDVTEEDEVEAAVDAAARGEGGLRISVCCAGVGWAEKVAGKRGAAPAPAVRDRDRGST